MWLDRGNTQWLTGSRGSRQDGRCGSLVPLRPSARSLSRQRDEVAPAAEGGEVRPAEPPIDPLGTRREIRRLERRLRGVGEAVAPSTTIRTARRRACAMSRRRGCLDASSRRAIRSRWKQGCAFPPRNSAPRNDGPQGPRHHSREHSERPHDRRHGRPPATLRRRISGAIVHVHLVARQCLLVEVRTEPIAATQPFQVLRLEKCDLGERIRFSRGTVPRPIQAPN